MASTQAQLLAKYFAILGVKSSASIQEVKDAFREKAKKLHPDVNPSTEAHLEFIMLKKAYNYVLDVKTGKIPIEKIPPKTQAQPQYKKPTYQPQQKPPFPKQQPNYQRARPVYRQKKHTNPEVLRDEKHGAIIIATILLALILPTYGILFITLPILNGFIGFVSAIIIIAVTSPLALSSYSWLKKYSKKDKEEAYERLKNSISFQFIAGALSAFLGFVFFASKTFIPLWVMPLILLIPSTCILLFFPKKSKKFFFRRKFQAFAFWPFILQVLFAINFIFSFQLKEEIMIYKPYDNVGFTSIRLPNNHYGSYPHIRTFFYHYQDIGDYRAIKYDTKTGLFGIRVLKKYQLVNYNYEQHLENVILDFDR